MNLHEKIKSKGQLNTPVLLLVFNRPDTTLQVFKAIRIAKPSKLYIAADGARKNVAGESKKVEEVRELITNNIDWKCEIHTLFRNRNLGCKYAVSTAIKWFFDNEEQGIILEDDCVPSQSFFWYCEELLDYYKLDESIYMISGDARGPESINMTEDYSFCKYPLIWGWATWVRAWKNYDPEIKNWNYDEELVINKISKHKSTQRYWKKIFNSIYNKVIDTWDYQFTYLVAKNNGKCIVPRLNLITNIGFNQNATHTSNANSTSANRPRFVFDAPLKHLYNKDSEHNINEYFDKNEFTIQPLYYRLINKLRNLF